MNRCLLICTFLAFASIAYAQKDPKNKDGLLIHFQYGYHIPMKIMAERFGNNFSLGGSVEGKWNTWLAGFSYQYLFGGKVKENVLAGLENSYGEMTGIDGHLARPILQERGYLVLANIGKLISINQSLQHFVHIKLGAGMLQHKVKTTDEYNVMPQIVNKYAFGYDRLTNGMVIQENIGYTYLSQNKRINFSIGLQFLQGFTKLKSVADFSTQSINDTNKSRLDLLNGAYVSWILPFYFQGNAEEIIY